MTQELLGIIRHGHYDRRSGNLTDYGVLNTEKLANNLRLAIPQRLLEPGMTIICTSQALRAQETGEIIAQILGLNCITIAALGGLDGVAYIDEVVERGLSRIVSSYPGTLLVTHRDQTEYIPRVLHPEIRFYQNPLDVSSSTLFNSKGRSAYVGPDRIVPPRGTTMTDFFANS